MWFEILTTLHINLSSFKVFTVLEIYPKDRLQKNLNNTYLQVLFTITTDWIKSNMEVVESTMGHNKEVDSENGRKASVCILLWSALQNILLSE